MKGKISKLTMVLMLLVAAGRVQASTVRYDYDRGIDATRWKRFAWRVADTHPLSLEERRIRRALVAGFAAKGDSLIEGGEQADFLVGYQAAVWGDVRVEGIVRGPGLGRYARIDRVPMGALVVEIFEGKSGILAWHGTVSDALAGDPDQAEQRIGKAVAKLLKKFPSGEAH